MNQMIQIGVAVLMMTGLGAAGSAMASATGSAAAAEQTLFKVEPYTGSRERSHATQAFDEYALVIGVDGNGDLVSEKLEGRVTKTVYDNPKGRSTLEVARNYEEALTSAGLIVRHRCSGRQECGGTGSRDASWARLADMNIGVGGDFRYVVAQGTVEGREVSVAVMVNSNRSWVYVVESEAMQTGMAGVTLEALESGLSEAGRVRLDGLYFDTGLAVLKPESAATLGQVAELLKRYPDLNVEIVGHTDDIGDDAANQRLSEARAQAVRKALVETQGIAENRLTARGAGESEPVAPNTTDEGRALNRRVELVQR